MSQAVTHEHDETPYETDSEQIRELDPPNLSDSSWGVAGKLWSVYQRYKKRQKYLDDGRVQWFLIEDSFPEPKFVKPTRDGSGIPYIEHNGSRYLMPRSAMVPSKTEGMWTIVHKAGDAEPLNLTDPSDLAIPPDALDEYITMGTSTSPPGLWDRLDLDSADLLRYGVLAIIAIAVLQGVMGGGIL